MQAVSAYSRKLRRWELALLLGACVSLLAGIWLSHEQSALADKVVRLHIIANSNSAEDQALKLQVRDRILEEASALLNGQDQVEGSLSVLESHLDYFTEVAAQVVRQAGYDYPVQAKLEETWFPTKEYDDFSFPAGTYTALRIIIGEGEGENWWCVLFPPLCMKTVTESAASVGLRGGLTEQEVALITGETKGYILKFKLIEIWKVLQKKLSR